MIAIICTTDALNGMVAEADSEAEAWFVRYVEIEDRIGVCIYPKNCWKQIDYTPPPRPWMTHRIPAAIITAPEPDIETDLP